MTARFVGVRAMGCALALALLCSGAAAAQSADCVPPPGVADTRPDPAGGPTEVSISVYVVDVVAIDDAGQRYTADVAFSAGWDDPRLAALAGCELPLQAVWNPRVELVNGRGFARMREPLATIGESGRVSFRQRGYGDLSAPLDLHDFPFDRQVLPLEAVAFGHGPEEVRFVADPRGVGRAERMLIAGWDIGEPSLTTGVYRVVGIGIELPSARLELEAHRQFGYYLWKLILPLCIVVFMAWLVLWIDPEIAPARIGLSATAVLTVFAYQFSISSALPRVSYLTRMDQFFAGASLMVGLGLVLSVGTVVLFRKGKQAQSLRLQRVSRWLFLALFLALSGYALWL